MRGGRAEIVLERPAQWPGHALHHGHTRQANQSPGDPVQRDEVGRIAHVVIAFDHQHLGKQLALRKVPIRRQKPQIGWRIGRLVPVSAPSPGLVTAI